MMREYGLKHGSNLPSFNSGTKTNRSTLYCLPYLSTFHELHDSMLAASCILHLITLYTTRYTAYIGHASRDLCEPTHPKQTSSCAFTLIALSITAQVRMKATKVLPNSSSTKKEYIPSHHILSLLKTVAIHASRILNWSSFNASVAGPFRSQAITNASVPINPVTRKKMERGDIDEIVPSADDFKYASDLSTGVSDNSQIQTGIFE